VTDLLHTFRDRLRNGRKLLVPYVMGGVPDAAAFPSVLAAVAEHADAVEIGLPFSDPLMDGPVIAAAGERVLRNGVGPLDALSLAGSVECAAPKLLMTYYNPIHKTGETEFCKLAAAAGAQGLIVPDLPLEESIGLRQAAADRGLAWIPLVAPTSSPERVESITATATGFVYAVSTLGVTGTRASLSERAEKVVTACRAVTDVPILVGIGVSNAEQARAAAVHADGVVVGSAVVALVMEQGAAAAGAFLSGLREALDSL
jgi:tryptophan synthase alpha chain